MRTVRLALKGLLLVVPLAILLLTVNYTVDGSCVLRGDKYELEIANAWLSGKAIGNFDNSVNERSVMKLYVDNLKKPLDCLVLGSSRAMQMTQEIVGASGRFFNAGMTGADYKDIFSTFYLFDRADKLPEQMVVEIDPWIFYDSDAALNFRDDNNLYCEFLNKCLGYNISYTAEDRSVELKALTSLSYFQENVRYYFADHSGESHPTVLPDTLGDYDYDIRSADGTQWYAAAYRNQTQDEVDLAAMTLASVDYAQLYGFTQVSAELAAQFEQFLAYAQSRGVTVTLTLTPFHPIYWAMLTTNPAYAGVVQAETLVRELGEKYGIDVYGSYDPVLADCTSADFYDGLHIRREAVSHYFLGLGQGTDFSGDTVYVNAEADPNDEQT